MDPDRAAHVVIADQQPWLAPAAILIAAMALGVLCRRFALDRLAAIVARTSGDLDDIALAAVRGHIPAWFALGGAVLAVRAAPLSGHAVSLVDRVCSATLVVSLTLATASFAAALLERAARGAGAALATTGVVQSVVRAAILSCGALLVLGNLGVSVAPLLAALGVGSLAVALALQPTLSNLIAGVHIAVARPIRVGDFVQIEDGTKGYVEDIGWRATRLRELPGNIIVVPNARLADMILTNYSLPTPEQAALVQVGVAYGSNLEAVERVTRDVGGEVLREIEGGVAAFEPFIRYHTFGDSSIDFTVILRVREFTDRYLVTHEFIKRLTARYAREGIEIPFPQRVLHGAAGSPAPARAASAGARS